MERPGEMFDDGAAYERLVGRWSRRVGETFLDWLAVPPQALWLDVGCGTGAFSEEIALRTAPAAIHGIDPSEAQLAYARSRLAGADFRAGVAGSLPYDDQAFDAATMALVIAFVPDPERAVAEMARVVRPGGLVAAYMWDIDGGHTPIEPILAALRSLGVDPKTGMFVEVTIGVQQPDKVDAEAVRGSLPHGTVAVRCVKGGLDVIDRERGDNAVIATAAIAVRLDLP
ncbi:MAG: hypothetical protein B7Z80_15090 [Rhodospirillales bacterium 20-64-7]|nr:MAG: hypothetical protein B7Z80_15090 [Rhodospirillales bacterium 20-64-7]